MIGAMRQAFLGSSLFLLSALLTVTVLPGCDSRRVPGYSERRGRSGGPAGREAAVTGGIALHAQEKQERTSRPTRQIIVYFADQRGEHLVPEIFEVTTTAVARAAVERLIAGPEQVGHKPTIPSGTRLLDLDIDGPIALVNFSREFETGSGGSTGELLTVFSVANTLTEFGSIESVRLLVEGRPIDTLAGHVDLSEPIGRAPALIRR